MCPAALTKPQPAEVPLQPSPAAGLSPFPTAASEAVAGSAPWRCHPARAGDHPTRRNHPARGLSAPRVCQCGGGRIAEPGRFRPWLAGGDCSELLRQTPDLVRQKIKCWRC